MTTKTFPFSSRALAIAMIAWTLPTVGLAEVATGANAGGEVLPVQAAGDYVEHGTMRIQVATKLGRPDLITPDGAWVYRNQRVAGTEIRGSLLVRFEGGRVSELSLAAPETVEALREGKVVALRPAMKRDSSRPRWP